jgi:ABC-2 type transport system ATP-binding protein
MSTHILQEAQSTCERILIINNGLLVADDTPEQLAQGEFGSIFVEVVSANKEQLNKNAIKEKFKQLEGVIDVLDERASDVQNAAFSIRYENSDPRREIFKTVVDSQLILLEFKRHRASLEETFRRLTTK